MRPAPRNVWASRRARRPTTSTSSPASWAAIAGHRPRGRRRTARQTLTAGWSCSTPGPRDPRSCTWTTCPLARPLPSVPSTPKGRWRRPYMRPLHLPNMWDLGWFARIRLLRDVLALPRPPERASSERARLAIRLMDGL